MFKTIRLYQYGAVRKTFVLILTGIVGAWGFGIHLPAGAADQQCSSFEEAKVCWSSGDLDSVSWNGDLTDVSVYGKSGDLVATADQVTVSSSGTQASGDLVILEIDIQKLVVIVGTDIGVSIDRVSINNVPVSTLAMLFGEVVDTDPELMAAKLEAIVKSPEWFRLLKELHGSSLVLKGIHFEQEGSSTTSLASFGLEIGDDGSPQIQLEQLEVETDQAVVLLERFRIQATPMSATIFTDEFDIGQEWRLDGLGIRPGKNAPPMMQQFFQKLSVDELSFSTAWQVLLSKKGPNDALRMTTNVHLISESLAAIKLAVTVLVAKDIFDEWRDVADGEIASQEFLDAIAGKGDFWWLSLDRSSWTLSTWPKFDAVYAMVAEQSGQSKEVFRKGLVVLPEMFIGRTTPKSTQLTEAVQGALAGPGTLQWTTTNASPVAVPDILTTFATQSLPGVLELLNTEVQFIEPPMDIGSHQIDPFKLSSAAAGDGTHSSGVSVQGDVKKIDSSDQLREAQRAYEQGDYETVVRLLAPYERSGKAPVRRVMANAYRKSGRFEEAAHLYEQLAELGDATSQFYVGQMYWQGVGVDQNNDTALRWLEKANAQGDRRARYVLSLSTQTIEAIKEVNPGLNDRASNVLQEVVQGYYADNDPLGLHFASDPGMRLPADLWAQILERWRTDDVIPAVTILTTSERADGQGKVSSKGVRKEARDIVSGETFEKKTAEIPSSESTTVATENSSSKSQLTTTGTITHRDAIGIDGTYTGELVDGIPNGQGTWIDADGNQYVGSWKDGKQHGQGTGTSPDGQKFVGEFKDGYSWDGFGYDKDGSVLATISKGHVQTD